MFVPWKYNNTRNTISFSVSKISFIFLMTPIDSTNDQNICVELHLHINNQAMQQRNLKLRYLPCYTRNIYKI